LVEADSLLDQMEKQSCLLRSTSQWPLFEIGDYPNQYRIELIERTSGA